MRRTLNLLASLAPAASRRVSVVQEELGGVPGEWLRCHDPKARRPCTILYFHGGYYIAGTPRLCRPFLAQVSTGCGADIFAADYRLAPEHPFPAALDDAEACYQALAQSRTEEKSIILAGDSAGGGLALALALKLFSHPLRPDRLAGIVLISPWLDLTLSADGLNESALHDPILQYKTFLAARHWYAQDHPYDDPLISPLFGSFDNLPPVLIMSGGRDIMRDDACRLAKRLQLTRTQYAVHEWEHMHHCWPISPIMYPEARRAAIEVGAFTRRVCQID